MALASLCSEAVTTFGRPLTLTGFIVDHKLREGSTEEARNVAFVLEKLKITPEILTLDWKEHGDPATLTNLESIARRLRYQALGKAARSARIQSLFVGHHADDQAETVLSRLVGGYLGAGLQAIQPVRPIPECERMYGVCESGVPRQTRVKNDPSRTGRFMSVESGGVNIVRPLLSFTKRELVTVCQNADVRWVEDQTNTDPTYTLRNTVRHLLGSDSLPKALQTKRLVHLANSSAMKEWKIERIGQRCFEETTIRLNIRAGTASFTIPKVYREIPNDPEAAYHVKLVVLRKIVNLIAPGGHAGLQDLHGAVHMVFNSEKNNNVYIQERLRCTVAETLIYREKDERGTLTYTVHRQPPRLALRSEQSYQAHLLPLDNAEGGLLASDWHLWDGRYWLRILSRNEQISTQCITVRFLSPADVAAARKTLPRAYRHSLDRDLRAVSTDAHYTLPAIFERVMPLDGGAPEEILVALPSLDWSNKDRWTQWVGFADAKQRDVRSCFWDIRYRSTDLKHSDQHTFENSDRVAIDTRKRPARPRSRKESEKSPAAAFSAR